MESTPVSPKKLTFSLVMETENLGMAGMEELERALDSLLAQTRPIEEAKEFIVITSGHVLPETKAHLMEKYPWITIHENPQKLEYTQAKWLGATLVSADIVFFIDSDMSYNDAWLLQMLGVFEEDSSVDIVAGQTRVRSDSIYGMALSLSWMFDVWPDIDHAVVVTHFHLNNFGIRREKMLRVPFYPWTPVYRGAIVEWKKALFRAGYVLTRAPNAIGYHTPPLTFMDWWYRMTNFGADAVVKADFVYAADGTVTEKKNILKRFARIFLWTGFQIKRLFFRSFGLLRENWKNIFRLVFAFPLAIVFIFATILGTCIAFVKRDFLYTKITAREGAHVV